MQSAKFMEQLRICVTEIVKIIRRASEKIADSTIVVDKLLTAENKNLETNTNVAVANIFPASIEENDILDEMAMQIQAAVGQLRKHASFIPESYDSLLDALYYFNFNGESFDEVPSTDVLLSFEKAMEMFLQSLTACEAACRGQLQPIEKFLDDDPSSKNRPLYNGETLLYIAAKENRIEVMKYLVEKVGCSVNAATLAEKTTEKNAPLHIAFIRNHHEAIRYLLDHGADCYQLNMKGKNPLTITSMPQTTITIVQEYLVLHYVDAPSNVINLPSARILDHLAQNDFKYEQFTIDCLWEYLKVDENRWEALELNESDALNKKFREKSNPNQELLIDEKIPIKISTINFKREEKESTTWIRCRGSSVYNFDVISRWQAMWIVHPSGINSSSPMPTRKSIYIDSNLGMDAFHYQLYTWYNMSDDLNQMIDQAMDQRFRYLIVDERPFDKIKFNLESFSFSNEMKTIEGYIRWLPEFVIIDQVTKRMTPLNHFQRNNLKTTNAQLLGHKILKEFSMFDEFEEFSEDADEISKDEQVAMKTEEIELSSVETHVNVDPTTEPETSDSTVSTMLLSIENTCKIKREEAQWAHGIKLQIEKTKKEDANALAILEKQMKEEEEKAKLITKLSSNTEDLSEYRAIKEKYLEQKKKCDEQEAAQIAAENHRKQLNEEIRQLQESIRSLKSNIEKQTKDLLDLGEVKYIIPGTAEVQLPAVTVEEYLKSIEYNGKTPENTKLISISSQAHPEKLYYQVWLVKGYSEHLLAMNQIITRTNNLNKVVQQEKQLYRQQLNQESTEFLKGVAKIKVRCNWTNWKTFFDIFQEFLTEEKNTMVDQFAKELGGKSKHIIGAMIRNEKNWKESLVQQRILFSSSHSMMKSMEKLKGKALAKYSDKMNETLQSNQYTALSIKAKEILVKGIQERFDSEEIYRGHQPQHFILLSSIINQIDLIIHCCKLQLPLFESAVELLSEIRSNPVTVITTGTGSGKSTLLPTLLVAAGYEKIMVTQPRRLPCNLLSKRVNSSMSAPNLSGWIVAGTKSKNVREAPIVYLTDGLMKEYLLYREQHLVYQARSNKHGLIIMIDEAHERSINIDLCLALLVRFLKKNSTISEKFKVIISSATLHPSVIEIFNQFGLSKKNINTPKLHEVKIHSNCSKNLIELICELQSKLDREEQILCFVKSTVEVRQSIKLLKIHTKLLSYPLVQSQSSIEQQMLIQKKQIFFSTTVAETSLTFPSLRYVIDTGVINMPVYDAKKNMTEVQELKAAKSTITQRQGRLGRTKSGDYYALYEEDSTVNDYPKPQILQTELTEIEFSLCRSLLKFGLDELARYMPAKPPQENIEAAKKRLQDLDIIDRSNKFTSLGTTLSSLPDFGSIAMSKAVLAALQKYDCGRDLIRLAAILSVTNTPSILRSIPSAFKRAEGDFMVLLGVMNVILDEKLVQPPHLFKIEEICQRHGLSTIQHTLKRALLRYSSFEMCFQRSMTYRSAAQKSSFGRWEPIARALLDGYSDNIFLSMAEIQSRKHRYIRYNVEGNSEKDTYAVLDTSSKLIRPLKEQPVALVVARDIHISSSMRNRSVISFLGEIQAQWIERTVQRQIKLEKDEWSVYSESIEKSPEFLKLSQNVQIDKIFNELYLSGATAAVLPLEIFIRNKLVKENTFNLLPDSSDKRLASNVEDLMKSLTIFLPLKWRWLAENQVKIRFSDKVKEGQVKVSSRTQAYQEVKKELDSFVGWLKDCVSVAWNEGVEPQRVIDPDTNKPSSDIASRIKSIADPTLTNVDLWSKLRGPAATRESRMEVVAWVAVCHFHCKLEGGFIRDWVLDKTIARPPSSVPSSKWLIRDGKIPSIDKRVIPSDLDCHLPSEQYFDLEKFLDEMYDFGIETDYVRQPWRYILIFDEHYPTGPFTMDLIEPHVAFTHNRIDFDVNNLYIKRDFCDSLGQRVDLDYEPFSIDLKKIIAQIKKKQFQLLRPTDNIIQERINKMESRGWTRTGGDWSYIPPPGENRKFVLALLPKKSSLYQKLEQQLQVIGNIKIQSIEQIRNPLVEKAYHAERNKIRETSCSSSEFKEECLFHGTSSDAAENILKCGFEQSYFSSSGLYGKSNRLANCLILSSKREANSDMVISSRFKFDRSRRGAYFAENPLKSDQYTTVGTDSTRKMFYCLVALGKVHQLSTPDSSLSAAPVGYNSVCGIQNPQMIEYIVYNHNQVLPYLIITYTKYTG